MAAPPPPASTDAQRADRRASWLVGGGALVLLAAGVPFGIPFSAGSAGALAILDGGWPYRDFWTIYAPGHFFLLAGLFATFGPKLIVAGAAAVVIEALACGAFFRLLRRVEVGRGVAALAALVLAGVLWKAGPTLTTYAPALLCGVAGLDRIVAAAAGRRARDAWLAGLWLGAAAWFKHDVAAYVAVAATMALVLTPLLRRERLVAGLVLRFAAGVAALALPGVALVAVTGGAEAWRDLVVFPLTEFPLTRPERYPQLRDAGGAGLSAIARASAVLQWLRHFAPLWIALWACAVVLRRRREIGAARLAAAIAAIVAAPLFFGAAHVQINTHVLSMSALAIGFVAVAWSAELAKLAKAAKLARTAGASGAGRAGRRRVVRGALALAALLLLAAFAETPARSAARAIELARRGRTIDLPAARGLLVAPREADELERAAATLREHTAPGEPIYVGVARHDAVVISRPELYLLLERRNATRYAELHPGIVDREAVQREIAADLERRGVRAIVRWHVGWTDERFDAIRERRRQVLPGTGSSFLDDWIEAHFEPIAKSGELEILRRRS